MRVSSRRVRFCDRFAFDFWWNSRLNSFKNNKTNVSSVYVIFECGFLALECVFREVLSRIIFDNIVTKLVAFVLGFFFFSYKYDCVSQSEYYWSSRFVLSTDWLIWYRKPLPIQYLSIIFTPHCCFIKWYRFEQVTQHARNFQRGQDTPKCTSIPSDSILHIFYYYMVCEFCLRVAWRSRECLWCLCPLLYIQLIYICRFIL